MIFDTSALLAILKDGRVLEKLGKVDAVRIPSVCAFELLRGAVYLNVSKGAKKELEVVMDLLEEAEIIPLEWSDVRIASYLWTKLKSKGMSVPDPDVMAAATAIRLGEKVVSADRDFWTIKEVAKELELVLL